MIICVSDDNIFVNPQTESMRRIELPFCRTQLSETNAGLHWDVLWVGCQSSTAAAGSKRGTWRGGWNGRRWPWLIPTEGNMRILKKPTWCINYFLNKRSVTYCLDWMWIISLSLSIYSWFCFFTCFRPPANPRLECYFHWVLNWSPSRMSLKIITIN